MAKSFFVVIVLLFFALYIRVDAAGTPSIFSYQGRLADANGDLLGGSGTAYFFKFSIWNVATGGTSGTNRLWPSSDPSSVSVTVRAGVFNVNIGDTADGYPDALDYDFNTGADIYLEVEVSSDDSTFETLSPRQRISSAVFAQLSGAVSGTGQSMFGTTTPVLGAVVTVEATTTSAIPLVIRGFLGQVEDLFRIITDTGTRLLTFTAGGDLGIGTTTPSGKLSLLDAVSTPQFRISQTETVYGEFYTDASGDIRISSTGGNIRQNDENFWVCSGGACGTAGTTTKGNIIVENSVIFDNDFILQQIDASTTIMYDTTGAAIFQFDEGE